MDGVGAPVVCGKANIGNGRALARRLLCANVLEVDVLDEAVHAIIHGDAGVAKVQVCKRSLAGVEGVDGRATICAADAIALRLVAPRVVLEEAGLGRRVQGEGNARSV